MYYQEQLKEFHFSDEDFKRIQFNSNNSLKDFFLFQITIRQTPTSPELSGLFQNLKGTRPNRNSIREVINSLYGKANLDVTSLHLGNPIETFEKFQTITERRNSFCQLLNREKLTFLDGIKMFIFMSSCPYEILATLYYQNKNVDDVLGKTIEFIINHGSISEASFLSLPFNDAFSNGNLKTIVNAERVVLYSVGTNRDDDKGDKFLDQILYERRF